jgi:quercetin dioxygenase-like cupin family protein
MIREGDSIVNPVTGERLVFELTSHDTGGAYTLFDTFVEPGGAVASAHVHPFQTEIFRVIEGRLGVKRGREKLEIGAGQGAMNETCAPPKSYSVRRSARRCSSSR